jgi:hypothetical protein
MTKKQQETTESVQAPDLAGEYESAKAQLQQLLDERQSLSAQLALAAGEKNFNADAFVASQERADRLPIFIIAAEVRVGRARIAVLEHKLISEEEAAQREIAVATEIYERLKALEAIYTAAITLRDNVRSAAAATRSDLSAARRAFEDKIRQNSRPHAPIVRSRIHAA